MNPLNLIAKAHRAFHPPTHEILAGITGTVRSGEMLLVLGKPDAGCTTFLKVLANRHESYKAVEGHISYDGRSPKYMAIHHRGELGYIPEEDIHLPTLTVQETLTVGISARSPENGMQGLSRERTVNGYVKAVSDVLGISHAFNTPIGNTMIRGISGGEKKRVSIAEMLGANVKLGCWDNATRGLDSSTALQFVHTLRTATNISKMTTIAALYQTSDAIYELFDKVALLHEGHLIYFGPVTMARQYFIDMGYQPAYRQTTSDFLVGVTDPLCRSFREGHPDFVPRTPIEFANYFNQSHIGQQTGSEVDNELTRNSAIDMKPSVSQPAEPRSANEDHLTRFPGAPYSIGLLAQLKLLMKRRVQIIKGDTITQGFLLFNFIGQGLFLGSVFWNLPVETAAYFSRGSTALFAIVFPTLLTLAEIPGLYYQRSIVARHHRAALYHPWIDAAAFTIMETPISFLYVTGYSVLIYFLSGFQREPDKFFVFLLIVNSVYFVMKALTRTIVALSHSEAEAQALGGFICSLFAELYGGFFIAPRDIVKGLRWISYINPLKYAFEALLTNELHGLNGQCSSVIPAGPGYENMSLVNKVCTTVGSQPGSASVDGDVFVYLTYGYTFSRLWFNFGILTVFGAVFLLGYLTATELASTFSQSFATRRLFKRGAKVQPAMDQHEKTSSYNSSIRDSGLYSCDKQNGSIGPSLSKNIFSWHHLTHKIRLHTGESRSLLNDISGYVEPGKLTALMGESGAGKTTLLNALAERLHFGSLTGDRLLNGQRIQLDFARLSGYCEQMDIHLETATVREALQFSAMLRQSPSVSKEDKYAYVEKVLKLCGMESYGDAIVGHVGEGLSLEQRKRLTIGVELAAKPKVLLFLDEPTSGLSAQSAWAIIQLLRSLTEHGQAILCTIHQPSAELLYQFDRILLLEKGGQTCYFGDVGKNAEKLVGYFESNGGRPCGESENPAEYMLDVIGAGVTTPTEINWHDTWNKSPEKQHVHMMLENILLNQELSENLSLVNETQAQFSASFALQFSELTKRTLTSYIRMPRYLLSKFFLDISAGLFIGFTFYKTNQTIQGAQNHIFSIYSGILIGLAHACMIQVIFVKFRGVYEARERASKTYHWFPMLISCLLVELPWNIIGSTLYYICWYWTVGFPSTASRVGFQYLARGILFPLYYSTFSFAVGVLCPTTQTANLASSFLYGVIIILSGFLQPYSRLISFWHWLYRTSPLTYFLEMQFGSTFGHLPIHCSEAELVHLVPPAGQSCNNYMQNFILASGGYLVDGLSTSLCKYCPLNVSDQYLRYRASYNTFYGHRWRDVGIFSAYIIFNVCVNS
ncbi:hypothetical protein M422DRAFT_222683 [Sphaerobolus stellatus SS14]|nr:hypothetical protein M422DRAFT_222683 [Sphaerobolus stellatus SS14]